MKNSKKKSKIFFVIIFAITLCILGSAALAGVFFFSSRNLPSIKSVREYAPSLVTRVYSDDNRIIGEFYVEKRVLVPFKAIPLYLKEAVIAVEDDRFYTHKGLDYKGIARAFWVNLIALDIKQGGSTITQQLAKNLFLTPEQNFMRKIKEAILAKRIEKVLSKDEIMELYLNQIYFGRGAYGVQAAAFAYLGKDVRDLTLPEAALIAGIIRSPNEYSPYAHPDRAKSRQKVVLKRMLEEGYITEDQYQKAYKRDIYLKKPEKLEELAPYFVEYVRQYVMTQYGAEKVYKGGLNIYTTLDYDLQKAATNSVKEGLRALDKRQGFRGPAAHKSWSEIKEWLEGENGALSQSDLLPDDIVQGIVVKVTDDLATVKAGRLVGDISREGMEWATKRLSGPGFKKVTFMEKAAANDILKVGDVINVRVVSTKNNNTAVFSLEQEPLVNGALLSVDPATGYIKAMVGGYDFKKSEFNRAVQSRRQPGSAFKPFVYGAAIEKGFTAATVLDDSPIRFKIPGWDKDWTPENYDGKFYGPVTLRDALAFSRNVVTIKLTEKTGIDNVINFARQMGIKSNLERNLSLALGSSGVSLYELTSAYGVFANQGTRVEPLFIKYITNSNGKILERAVPAVEEVLNKQTAYILTNMMQDVIQKGTARSARSLGKTLAGKTGTTNDFTDAWFVGFAPNLVTGTWVGFDDIRSLGRGEAGARAALPIWISYMRTAIGHIPTMDFSVPEDITYVKIDPYNGLLASPGLTDFAVEVFKKGTEPSAMSSAGGARPARFHEDDEPVD
ncbi:MAG: PBP1A family penicillin-binding protein [Nitrospirae bacterium]|nr:PBP1A family penicillin-binding protein [Nitrospirota bacterium]